MKVLVTGANGFLGRAVVDAALADGLEVVAAVRSMPVEHLGAEPDDRAEPERRRADLRTDDLAPLLEDVDVVVHLAAQVAGSDEARFASTVVGTERLLTAVAASRVTRFILVSSYSVYDWQAAGPRLDESSPVTSAPHQRDGYTVAKVWQEKIVREFAARSHVEVAVLRPGFIWGPGKEDLAGAGARIGPVLLVVGPRMRLPLTFVSNCADAVVAACRVPGAAGTTLNVVDGRGVTAWRYSRMLTHLDQGIAARIPVPYSWGRALAAVLSVVMPRIFDAGGKLPGVLVPASFAARFRPVTHGADRAADVLGWRPRVGFGEAEKASLGAADSSR